MLIGHRLSQLSSRRWRIAIHSSVIIPSHLTKVRKVQRARGARHSRVSSCVVKTSLVSLSVLRCWSTSTWHMALYL